MTRRLPSERCAHRKLDRRSRSEEPARENPALLVFAQAATAAQVERFVGAWRRVDRVAAAEAGTRHLGRHLSTLVDDDGMIVIRGRLTPEVGAVVQRALEAAADRLCREAQDAAKVARAIERQAPNEPTTAGGTARSTGHVTDEVTPAQRRADALGLLAEAALTADLDRGSAGDRYQVLHIDASLDSSTSADPAATIELDHGALHVSAETSRRLACDASVVTTRHDGNGTALDVGRKTRTVPPSIRRALDARDRSCRFPGCTSRRCDAHHVTHWIDGGETSLDNLVLLRRRHHRAVHEGGFDVTVPKGGPVSFKRPDGVVIQPAPAPPESLARLDATPWEPDDIPVWDGTPFNVVYAIDVLYASGAVERADPPS